MKPVSGSITSSKPISLSKAARTLSKFISTDNGASQAVSAYLKRASSSFNELIQFHKDLESGKLDRTKHKKSHSQTAENIGVNLSEGLNRVLLEHPSAVSQREEDGLERHGRYSDVETGDLDDGGRKSERKKKENKRRELLDEREEGKRKEKKRKKIEIEDELDDSNEKHKKKKKKRIKQEGEDE